MPQSNEDTLAADAPAIPVDMATIVAEPPRAEAEAATMISDSAPRVEPPLPRQTLHPLAPRIGKFSILRKLGEGGMGVVYAGYDEELSRKVAIKLLRGKVRTDGRRHRLVREAQGLARLSHPNVVQVYEIGTQGDDEFIAMEFVDGTTLGTWLQQESRTRTQILEAFISAGRGLAAAHAKDLVHRDFKPDNVMVTREGRVVVMDFGLVHEATNEVEAQARVHKMHESSEIGIDQSLRISALSTDLTATGALMGTPAYMSPEQFVGRRTDARTDQFSFCVALWEALCGERPYAGDNFGALCLAVTQGHRRAPPRGKLTNHLRKTIERGLAGDVEQRWPNMDALLEQLAKNPARRRMITAAALAPVVLGLVAWQTSRYQQAAEREQIVTACEAEGEAITEVWNVDSRTKIGAAFQGTGLGYADDAWARTQQAIDTWATEWSTMRSDTCKATRVEAERDEAEYEQIAECLDERRASLRAFVDVMQTADAELVNHAIQMAAGLPVLTPCVDSAQLAQRMRPPDEQREAIAALRARLQGVGLLVGARPQPARDEAAAVLEEALALGWPPLEAEARAALSLADMRLANYEPAQQELERAFFLAGDLGHDRLALRAATGLVDLNAKREQYPMAMHWASIASMFITRLELDKSNEAAELASARGNVLSNQNQLDEARAEHEHARQIWTDVLGPEHPMVAVAWANIGIVLRKQGDYPAALESMTKSLRLREAQLGPNHPRVAESIYNMGNVRRQLGQDDEALALFEQALGIWKAALGPRHRNVAFALNNIGNFYFGKQDFDKALEYYTQAREIWEEALGPEHSEVALAVNNIGNIHYSRKEWDQALEAYGRAQAIAEKVHGPEHPSVALSLGNIASLHQERGEIDKAIELHERTLAIFEKANGPDHPDVANALMNLGNARLANEDRRGARRELERALEIIEKREVDPMMRAGAEFSLAKIEWEDGNRQSAKTLALAARERAVAAKADGALKEIDAWLEKK